MKFLTWNIRSGGGTRISRIISEIGKHNPDFLALTEFRADKESEIRALLNEADYEFIETSSPSEKENGLLIASKIPFSLQNNQTQFDSQRWLHVNLSGFETSVLSVHVPGAPDHKFVDGTGISGQKRKEIFWDRLLTFAQENSSKKSVILGDFNTGLKIDAQGAPFKLSDRMRKLYDIGYIDTWRHFFPEERDYTYFSQQKVNGETRDYNGFRLDYIYISPCLKENLLSAQHMHEPRLSKISDHSILISEINL